jgi:5-hydroxyisourate hydrolase-like protein (transthyretin family)
MRKGWIVLIVVTATALAVVGAATLQSIAGTVLDSGANPLQGIRVVFLDAANAELLASTTTDSSGHYDSGTIPIGNYRVQFSDPGGVFQSEFFGAGRIDDFCGGTIVPVLASTTTDLDADMRIIEPSLIATIEGPIFGTVVDAATGTPLAGIRVSILKSWNAEAIGTVITDADGVFSFGAKEMLTTRIRFSDPTGTFFSEFYGAGSDDFCSAPIVTGKVKSLDGFLDRVPPEHLTQQLAETVQSYGLPTGVATVLGTPLTQVRALLADDNAANDAAACGQLASFVTRVDVQERRGALSTAQASELRSLAASLRTALGCH